MHYVREVEAFRPRTPQEERDRQVMLDYMGAHGDGVLFRSDPIAHFSGSAFVLNPDRSRVLLVRHRLRGVWSWTGGHADGNPDLLEVALKETMEETGVTRVSPLFSQAVSLEILTMNAHWKNGEFVSAHLHLNLSYCLICPEDQPLSGCPEENAGAAWWNAGELGSPLGPGLPAEDLALYQKLLARAGG